MTDEFTIHVEGEVVGEGGPRIFRVSKGRR